MKYLQYIIYRLMWKKRGHLPSPIRSCSFHRVLYGVQNPVSSLYKLVGRERDSSLMDCDHLQDIAYPLVNVYIAIENDHRNNWFTHYINIVIFHSYVSLPEGSMINRISDQSDQSTIVYQLYPIFFMTKQPRKSRNDD